MGRAVKRPRSSTVVWTLNPRSLPKLSLDRHHLPFPIATTTTTTTTTMRPPAALLFLLPTLTLAQSTPLATFTSPPPSLPLDLSAPTISIAWTIPPTSPLVGIGLLADLWFLPANSTAPPEFEYPVARHIVVTGAGEFVYPLDTEDFWETVGKNVSVGGEGRRYVFELRFEFKGEAVLVAPDGTAVSEGYEVKGVESGAGGRGVGRWGVLGVLGVVGVVGVLMVL